MLMSSDVNRKGRSRLEHPALRKDQRFRVEHFVAGLERRSVPPGLPRGLKGEPISLARGPYFCLFLPFSSLPPDVFPAQMEGVKLVVNKVLSSHFQVLPLSGPFLLLLPACPWIRIVLHTFHSSLSQAVWDK